LSVRVGTGVADFSHRPEIAEILLSENRPLAIDKKLSVCKPSVATIESVDEVSVDGVFGVLVGVAIVSA
jgi:hypothetical protein